MSFIKEIAEGLNEMYIQRQKVPMIMDKLNAFVKDNVMQDLIDLGSRINGVKQHHSPQLAVISLFLPRTVANFSKFDKDMTKFVDDETAEEQIEIKPKKINGKKKSKKNTNYFGIDNLEYVKRN